MTAVLAHRQTTGIIVGLGRRSVVTAEVAGMTAFLITSSWCVVCLSKLSKPMWAFCFIATTDNEVVLWAFYVSNHDNSKSCSWILMAFCGGDWRGLRRKGQILMRIQIFCVCFLDNYSAVFKSRRCGVNGRCTKSFVFSRWQHYLFLWRFYSLWLLSGLF